MTCPVCHGDRWDVCAAFGHTKPPIPYRAHGAQLRVPPEAVGEPWDQYILHRPIIVDTPVAPPPPAPPPAPKKRSIASTAASLF